MDSPADRCSEGERRGEREGESCCRAQYVTQTDFELELECCSGPRPLRGPGEVIAAHWHWQVTACCYAAKSNIGNCTLYTVCTGNAVCGLQRAGRQHRHASEPGSRLGSALEPEGRNLNGGA
eukprot:2333799-Rhodomonas_salina.1